MNDTLELQSDNGEQTLGILPIEGIENKAPLLTPGLVLTQLTWK